MFSTASLAFLAFFIRKPVGKSSFYFVGALLVLGPEQITFQKLIYLTLIFVIALNSAFNVKKNKYLHSNLEIIRSAFGVFNWLALLIFYLTSISFSQGNSLTDTARSLFPLILALIGFPLILDVGLNIGKEKLLRFTVYIGVLSSLFVWYFWTNRRGFQNFNIERIGLDAEWLGFLALIVLIIQTEKIIRIKAFDFIAMGLIIGLLVLTLTRTNLLIVLYILFSGLLLTGSKLKMVGSIAAYIFLIAAIVQSNLLGLAFSNAFFYRITRSLQLFRFEGLSSSGIGGEGTLQLRSEQTEQARQVWGDNLIFGTGILPKNQIFDTFMATPAQFGIIGILIFTMFSYKFMKVFFHFAGKSSLKKVGYIYFTGLFFSSFIYNWPLNKSVWISSSLLMILAINQFSKSNEIFYTRPATLEN